MQAEAASLRCGLGHPRTPAPKRQRSGLKTLVDMPERSKYNSFLPTEINLYSEADYHVGTMDATITIQQPRKSRASFFWSLTAFGIAIYALLYVGYVLREFYFDTSSIAAGTEIRPMGVTFHLSVTWTASILFGGACALIGGIIALIQRRRHLAIFAFVAGVATWIPMFVSNRGFDYIVTLRKLVLEP